MSFTSLKDSLTKIREGIESIAAGTKSLGITDKQRTKPGNPFDRIGRTPALDALKFDKPVIAENVLSSLIALIEKAALNDEALVKVAKFAGYFVKAASRAIR